MGEIVGAFGRVTEIKALKTQGVSIIRIEVPIEHHKKATNAFFDADVLITLGRNENGIYGVFTPETDEAESEPEKPKEKSFYKELFRLGWFNNPNILKAFGTDKSYQDFVRTQTSCVSGQSPVEFAHVRRIQNGAGTGIKPDYSGVPLTHEEHMKQHNEGESAIGGREFLDKELVKHRQAWIKSIIYKHFGVTSLSDINHDDFLSYIAELGIDNTIPLTVKGVK